ncbi:MAG TPA: SRPBCC family protein [Streptomyces sp.]|nr:SRPBCC family protein [Streptomyces sp.]
MNPHSDTLTTADGRTALRMERRLAHPPQRVWDAITQPAHLAQWFPSEVTVDLRPGGTVGFLFPGDSEPAMTGKVTDAREPHVFAFTWGEDHLRWEITPDGEGSLLTLTHTFGDRFGAASFASGWHVCITALGQLLDGEKADVARPRHRRRTPRGVSRTVRPWPRHGRGHPRRPPPSHRTPTGAPGGAGMGQPDGGRGAAAG